MGDVYPGVKPPLGGHMPMKVTCSSSRKFLGVIKIWCKRIRDRRELGTMSERQLNDMRMSWPEIAAEIEKPFWRE